MPAAEIGAALTSLKTAFDLTKAMKDVHDATLVQGKDGLQRVIMEAQASAIEAREAHSAQAERISALEAEVARLKKWDAEKQNYEPKSIGPGSVAYMLNWLCPTCFAKGQPSFLQPTGVQVNRGWVFRCIGCGSAPTCNHTPTWDV